MVLMVSQNVAHQIADLAAALPSGVLSLGPPLPIDAAALELAVYNQMADLAGLPHAPEGSKALTQIRDCMLWAKATNELSTDLLSEEDFATYISACLEFLTAAMIPSEPEPPT